MRHQSSITRLDVSLPCYGCSSPETRFAPRIIPSGEFPISTLCHGYAPFPVTAIRSTLTFVAAPSPRSPAPLSSNLPEPRFVPNYFHENITLPRSCRERRRSATNERRLRSRNAFVADGNRTIEACSRGRMRCLLQNARFHRNGRAPGSRAESDSRS